MTQIEKLIFAMLETGALIKNPVANDQFELNISFGSKCNLYLVSQINDQILIKFDEDQNIYREELFHIDDLKNFLIQYPSIIETQYNKGTEKFYNDLKSKVIEVLKGNVQYDKKYGIYNGHKEIELTYEHKETQTTWITTFTDNIKSNISYLEIGTNGIIREDNQLKTVFFELMIPALELYKYPVLKEVVIKNDLSAEKESIYDLIKNNTKNEKMKQASLFVHLSHNAPESNKKDENKIKL